MIDKDAVAKLAKLARIKLSEQEAESMGAEIDSVLNYVSELKEVDVGDLGVPGKDELPLRNVLREDGEPHESGKFSDALLREAPSREGNYVKVKKIL